MDFFVQALDVHLKILISFLEHNAIVSSPLTNTVFTADIMAVDYYRIKFNLFLLSLLLFTSMIRLNWSRSTIFIRMSLSSVLTSLLPFDGLVAV